MLALVKSGLRNSWILTAGNLGTSCFTRHFFFRKLQKITKNDRNFQKNNRKRAEHNRKWLKFLWKWRQIPQNWYFILNDWHFCVFPGTILWLPDTFIFPVAWVKLNLKYPRSTTQGANIKEGSMDSRTGMARRMMCLIRTKMFLFWKNYHLHPKRIYSIMMSIYSTCCYIDTITMFSTQWDKPMCDETISPACVATVPGFPGCLEVWLSFHASCHIFGDKTWLDSQSLVLIAFFRMIHIQLHQSS